MDRKPLIYQFDDVRVDLDNVEVIKADRRPHLEPKAFEALVFLIENRGRLVEKKELLDAVWKDAFVTENAMTRVIAQVRKALGEDSKESKYIETVPTRGYRFIADVTQEVEPGNEKAIQPDSASGDRERPRATSSSDEQAPNALLNAVVQPDTKRRGGIASRRTLVATVGVLIVGLAVALSYPWIPGKSKPSSDGASIRSIAVLPFKPLVVASHNELIEMGITDALISRLGSIKEIVVRPMSAVREYTDPDQDAVAIGKTLGVDAVLDSSIQMVGDKTRVRTQLVRVSDRKQIWRFECDDKCVGIFDLQDSISQQIISALTLTLTAEEAAALTKRYTNDPETYKLYLMGSFLIWNNRFFWNDPCEGDVKKAIDYFQQVLVKEPKYAPAYSGLADCYTELLKFGYKEGMTKARDAAARAVALDDTLAEAHVSMGQVRLVYDWDFSGAEKEFKRSIDLSPNYAIAHYYYASYLTAVGRHDEAIKEATRAAELEPASIVILNHLGMSFYRARRYDESLEQWRKVEELNSRNSFDDLRHYAYRQKGMIQEAVASFLKMLRGRGESKQVIESFRSAYETGGARGFWQKFLRWAVRYPEGPSTAWNLAIGYAALDDKDNAFAQLEKMYYQRDDNLLWLKCDALWDNLRSDPRFDDLVRRVGIPE